MAYKVLVQKPRVIRALPSSSKMTITDVSLQKSSVSVTKPFYTATFSSRVANIFSSFINLNATAHHQKLNIVNLVLDPFSINRYLVDNLSISESIIIQVSATGSSVLNASAFNVVAFKYCPSVPEIL